MGTRITLGLFTATLLAVAPAAAWAQPPGKAKGKDKDKKEHVARAPERGRTFTEVEFRTFHDYYVGVKDRPAPLPPGIVKRLERGKPLPPGIAKRRLPDRLVVLLPPRPDYELMLIGDRVVMLDRKGLVVDISLRIF